MATSALARLSLFPGVVMEESDMDRRKWQTWVRGKCNQMLLERGMYPPLSEWPESVH